MSMAASNCNEAYASSTVAASMNNKCVTGISPSNVTVNHNPKGNSTPIATTASQSESESTSKTSASSSSDHHISGCDNHTHSEGHGPCEKNSINVQGVIDRNQNLKNGITSNSTPSTPVVGMLEETSATSLEQHALTLNTCPSVSVNKNHNLVLCTQSAMTQKRDGHKDDDADGYNGDLNLTNSRPTSTSDDTINEKQDVDQKENGVSGRAKRRPSILNRSGRTRVKKSVSFCSMPEDRRVSNGKR